MVKIVELEVEEITCFQNEVLDWWEKNKRDLPWRKNPTPYNVLVSEIMLQQTQVSRVIPKFHEFLSEFPDIQSLAEADTKHLLKVWSGLGYNRRAIWLRDAAKEIAERGDFPRTIKELRSLKGVGPYTSRSILIFAFNEEIATVDTNIRRVLIASGFTDECTSEKDLLKIAEALVPKGRSSDWHNALMDYGSAVLTASSTGIAPTSRQPKFEGSARQIRGRVIQILTEEDPIPLEILHSRLNLDSCDLAGLSIILEKLETEGLVEKLPSNSYTIPS